MKNTKTQYIEYLHDKLVNILYKIACIEFKMDLFRKCEQYQKIQNVICDTK